MSEIFFASSNPKDSYKNFQLKAEKKIRKIAPRIFTSNFDEEPSVIVRRNILEILGNLYPNAILSHRSAFEFKPTSTGQIFVTYKYTKKIKLPGVTINFLKGKGPINGDNCFFDGLYISSKERALLENLQITKNLGPDSKNLSIPEIEKKLDDIIRIGGEAQINEVRDRAREISEQLSLIREFESLNRIIGALLSTKPSNLLKSDLALSRANGFPFDRQRIELFEILFNYLQNRVFPQIEENNNNLDEFRNFAFFEAYFSNYIEGTTFEVSEAKNIIDSGMPMPARDSDSHDILGTYQLVSNRDLLREKPKTADDLITIIQSRHKILLSARTHKLPGQFKERNNRAGNTVFVDYKLVRGTLKRGFEFYRSLTSSFAAAVYMMFMISEIHPFEDGNGRIARVMMNSELVHSNKCKIIIPTVYRDDYILTIKRLTNQRDPVPYTDMLLKAHLFSHKLNYAIYDDLYSYLMYHNAFFEPDEGKRLLFDS